MAAVACRFRTTASLERIEEFAKSHDTKFLVFLRNPVERAFSHYVHDLRVHHINQQGWIYKGKERFLEVYDKSFFDNFCVILTT